MSTLLEIEKAAEMLPRDQQRELWFPAEKIAYGRSAAHGAKGFIRRRDECTPA